MNERRCIDCNRIIFLNDDEFICPHCGSTDLVNPPMPEDSFRDMLKVLHDGLMDGRALDKKHNQRF